MSFAIRGDGLGYRAIDNVSDLLPGETFSASDPVLSFPPAPLICSAWQIRSASNALGIRTLIETAIKNSGDQNLIDAWEYSSEFHRDNSKISQIATAIGKTGADIDALFSLAITLHP